MKAITLWQPYADLMVQGAKVFETRSWMTAHRGPLAIHAGKAKAGDAMALADRLGIDPDTLDYGKVIGVVWLHGMNDTTEIDVRDGERALGDWRPGRYAWRCGSPLRLWSTVQLPGAQKLWDLPYDVSERIWEQLVRRGWPDA